MRKTYRLLALLLSLLLLLGALPFTAAATDGEATVPPSNDDPPAGTVTPPADPQPPVDPVEALPFTLTYFFSTAEYDESTKTLNFFVPDDLTEVELTLTFDEGYSGTVFADSNLTQAVKLGKKGQLTIKPAQMYTYLYIKCNEQANITYRISVISMRTPMEYRDDHLIADWARVYVNYCNELGYGIIQGDQNRNANPNNPLTRYEIATIAARMLGTDTSLFASSKLPYADSIASWAKSGVNAMTALGVINGHKVDKELHYLGNDNVTREQVAKIMVELALLREGSKKTAAKLYKENQKAYDKALAAFADTKSISSWAVPYMALAVSHYKFLSGSKENGGIYLNPTKNITRQEMTAIVARELDYDIDTLLEDLLLKVEMELAATNKPASKLKAVKAALSKAQAAYRSNSDSKKEKTYIALYKEAKNVFHSYVVYLSPSNQLTNPYTGVDTNEGAQMQAVADLLKPMLEEMGFTVYIADPTSNIRVRGADAKSKNADIYVAIHSNATGGANNGSWQGSLIFHSNNSGSKELAESVSKYLSKVTPTADSGIKNDSYAEAPFVEIRDPEMANILAEVEFHDYPTYAKWIVNNKKKLAQAFADGIWEYFYGN